jgi:hypothetical protein
LFQKELDAITTLDVIDEYDGFASDEFELEEDVDEEELVALGCVGKVLREEGGGGRLGKSEDGLMSVWVFGRRKDRDLDT